MIKFNKIEFNYGGNVTRPNQTKDNWLDPLPVVGENVQVLLKGNYQIIKRRWCRITSDGQYLHLGNLKHSNDTPKISCIEEIAIDQVLMISFFDTYLKFLIREKAP